MVDKAENSKTDKAGPGYTDDELLQIVSDQNKAAVGFEDDAKLSNDREQALNYYKGVMDDVPALKNRSKAVSSDVADGVETALPDLVEIFTGGEDVAAFRPVGQEDEEQAKQETDYVLHVVFQDNPGFMTCYTAFKDALLEKTGVFNYWWEENVESIDEGFEGKTAAEVQLASQDGEVVDLEAEEAEGGQEPTYSFTLRRTKNKSGAKIAAVSPDDFKVAPDTVDLKKTTYCAMRARPRVQDLIDRGIDEELVKNLPAYSATNSGGTEQARDTADESSKTGLAGDVTDDLRQVEVVTHCIRLRNKVSKKTELWRIDTDGAATKLLKKDKINAIPFAVITPFPITHRIIGRSLADLLVEIQRIKTALMRMALDSGYFALNQRMEVADNGSNEFTISDLVRSEPGSPIRVKAAGTIKPVSAGKLNFDVFGALEYFSTDSEQRTGIVRNTQGLNPDTLHDTAAGAITLMRAAQKRIRLIARIFAETGVKDLFLGVHALLRENQSVERTVRLSGKWVPVNPSEWSERNDMTIEVGLGAAGREHDLMAAQQVQMMMGAIVAGQGGGATGPIVLPNNVYNLAVDTCKRLGIKAPDRYFTDPTKPPEPGTPPAGLPPPPPDPAMEKVKADAMIAQQAAAQKAQADAAKSQQDGIIEQRRQDMEAQIKREQMAQDAALRREQMQQEIGLKRYQIDREIQLKAAGALMDASTGGPGESKVGVGGQPG